jgi:hypothetical protein
MKKLILIVIVATFLTGCGGRKVNKKMVRTIIGGEWIIKSYADELKVTGSPYKAGKKLKGITEMKIITNVNDRNDSIRVMAALNNHEGYTFKLFLEKIPDGIKVRAFPSEIGSKEKFELQFDFKNDSVIKMIGYDESGNIIESVEYLKLSDDVDTLTSMTLPDIFAIKNILHGKFNLEDANKKVLSEVSFGIDGKVKGFMNYRYFRLLTDFIASGVEFDFLMLGADNNGFRSEKEFGVKTFTDRIELYSVKTGSTEFYTQMDKLEFILKRN